MKELTQVEMTLVSGGTTDGALFGLVDGMATGMAIGGKWGGAGGLGFGALSQLVGLIVPTVMGGALGLVYGAMTDENQVDTLLADYRDKFGPGNTSFGSL